MEVLLLYKTMVPADKKNGDRKNLPPALFIYFLF